MCPDRKDGLFCGMKIAKTPDKNHGAPSGKPTRPIPIKLI